MQCQLVLVQQVGPKNIIKIQFFLNCLMFFFTISSQTTIRTIKQKLKIFMNKCFNSLYLINYKTKLMGQSESKEARTLHVATLNYSGLINSPFQYFSEQMYREEEKISKIFQRNLKTHIKGYKKSSFKWGLGKIDQKMQKERYAAIYDPKVGILNGRLLNKPQFMKQWDKVFSANVKQIKNLEYNETQKQNARNFDYFCYKSIVEYVYNIKEFQSENLSNLNPNTYQLFMQRFFSKAILNQQKKIKKTVQAMKQQQVDVFFFQETNSKLISAIDKNLFYVVTQNSKQSAIVIKKSSFKNQKFYDSQTFLSKLSANLRKSLNWNNDTVFAFVGNYIFISGHLSSKTDKNNQQVEEMKKSLSQLLKQFPQKRIVVGADANNYLPQAPEGFGIFPEVFTEHTTIKVRTFMQPQVNKAQIIASTCRDHLLTTGIFSNQLVGTISKKYWKKISYLPCEQHPYDHFMVTADIDFVENQ